MAIVDDQSLIRTGIRLLVDHEPDMVVVGEGTTGREALTLARDEHPDVMLVDVRMPELDGLSATEAIVADPALETTRVVVLTTFGLDEYVEKALRVGASGFLLKDSDPDQLLRAIREVAAGRALIDPAVTRAVIDRLAGAEAPVTPPATRAVDEARLRALTAREREVLALVGRGLSNTEIAEQLFISPATARTHVGRLLAKLDARDRAQLVVIAFETGVVEP
ncbi:MAG TPA: response regulator transcription factor [Microthrixaceae bacterium]|nr:response regulator transcription factor [Microthrixaceae bacterium]